MSEKSGKFYFIDDLNNRREIEEARKVLQTCPSLKGDVFILDKDGDEKGYLCSMTPCTEFKDAKFRELDKLRYMIGELRK